MKNFYITTQSFDLGHDDDDINMCTYWNSIQFYRFSLPFLALPVDICQNLPFVYGCSIRCSLKKVLLQFDLTSVIIRWWSSGFVVSPSPVTSGFSVDSPIMNINYRENHRLFVHYILFFNRCCRRWLLEVYYVYGILSYYNVRKPSYIENGIWNVYGSLHVASYAL